MERKSRTKFLPWSGFNPEPHDWQSSTLTTRLSTHPQLHMNWIQTMMHFCLTSSVLSNPRELKFKQNYIFHCHLYLLRSATQGNLFVSVPNCHVNFRNINLRNKFNLSPPLFGKQLNTILFDSHNLLWHSCLTQVHCHKYNCYLIAGYFLFGLILLNL